MTAPEKIWIDRIPLEHNWHDGEFIPQGNPIDDWFVGSYIRLDLHETALADKDKRIEELKTTLNEAAPVTTWQPIESAPKDGTHILVASSNMMTVAHYHQDGFYLSWNARAEFADFNMQYIAHWQPLPETPKE